MSGAVGFPMKVVAEIEAPSSHGQHAWGALHRIRAAAFRSVRNLAPFMGGPIRRPRIWFACGFANGVLQVGRLV